ncbi:MAG: NAD(P)/FAD-dependent oxidoreductase, partial [Anaerolineales bacterium]|nr:NAD(P)/FAD-dependent oxidoreductase [Anaerolineales bacterium]
IIDHTEFMHIPDAEGRKLVVYCDPDRLEAHLKEISPADTRHIEALTAGIRKFKSFDMSVLQSKPRSLMNLDDWRAFGQAMTPFLAPLMQWGRVSASDFAARFKDPFLQRAIPQMFAWTEIPMMVGMSLLAYMDNRNAGFPQGASLEFARAIEKRYLALGGQIDYNAQVEKILVKDGKATGVRLYNDEVHHAEVIISACDGRGTIFDLLDGEFTNRRIRRMYAGHLPIRSQVQVSYGVDRDLSGEPHWQTYLLDEPLLITGEERHELGIKHYCFDPSLAPAGKSAIICMLPSDYGYWQRIYGRRLYDKEQDQVSEIVLDFLEEQYPGLKGQVEFIDEATPLSYERYTGSWEGATTGWLLTKDTMMMMVSGVKKTLPGLDNFYLAGQWVEPGGSVPIVAMSGRNVIQLLCHADGKEFIATTV